jgi:hypothetical protein
MGTGCATIRIHNPGRAEIADAAVKLSTEIRDGSANPFDSMEENLKFADELARTGQKIAAEAVEKTYWIALNAYTPEEFEAQFKSIKGNHSLVKKAFETAVSKANEEQANQMKRDPLIKDSFARAERQQADGKPLSLVAMLELIQEKEKQIDSSIKNIQSLVKDVGGQLTLDSIHIKEIFTAIGGVLEGIDADEQVVAARALVENYGEAILLQEKRRLQEIKRHIQGISQIKKKWESSEALYEFLVKALEPMVPQLSRYGKSAYEINVQFITNYKEDESVRNGELLHLWMQFLHDYTALNMDLRPRELDILLDLGIEMHRHSVRMEEIDARERLDLVHSITSGAQIYYAGGIKPSEVYQLMLFTVQAVSAAVIAED